MHDRQDVCITVYYNVHKMYEDMPIEYEQSFQYYGIEIIPPIGSRFSIWTSRDKNGNYAGEGKTHEVLNGKVTRVDFDLNERGKDAASWSETLYISIYVEGEKF